MDATSQQITDLVEWATKHGARLHPSVEVYDDPQTGLSFRVKPSAEAPVQPHEPIVTIPSAISLSYLNALAENENGDDTAGRLHPEVLAGLAPHVIGRLMLVREFIRGEASFWWPYIRALPLPTGDSSTWALPPFWDADDAELLDGTNVQVGVERIRADVSREVAQVRSLLDRHHNGPDDVLARSFSPALYHWAYCVFSSRSFRPSLVLSEAQRGRLPAGVKVDDFSVLLPLFDVGNHDMTVGVRWDLDTTSANGGLSLRVAREHRAGEQVFNNYGLKTNAELLLGYGFMLPVTEELHNDYIHVRKRTGPAPATASDEGPPEEFFVSLRPMLHPSSVLGLSKQPPGLTASSPVLPVFQHVQPALVWDIFCAIAPADHRAQLIPLLGEDAAAASQGPEDEDSVRRRRFLCGQVGPECKPYLEQAVAVVQHKVLQELERLNETDVEVDEEQLEQLERNQRMALEYRERCRRVLEGTLEAINGDEYFDE